MKYGLTRYVNVYNFESERGERIIATAGDYIRSQNWCKKNVKADDDGMADLLQTYAWAYFALKRSGKLEEYGLAPEVSQDALMDMADTVSVFMEQIEDDSLPLAPTPEA